MSVHQKNWIDVAQIHCMVCDRVEVYVGRKVVRKCPFCNSEKTWTEAFIAGDKHKHCLFVVDHDQVDA